MPVSMVDERAMSVVTWLNAPKCCCQKVLTMSDHLAIRGFNQMNEKVVDSIEHNTDLESLTYSKTHRRPLGNL